MINKLLRVELNADTPLVLEPNGCATLVTGFSGAGKTLMFKLITFALGENEKIDVKEAKKQFPGLISVKLMFSNGYIFERFLDDNYYGNIRINNESDNITLDEKKYKEYVGSLFGHENVKVLKKGNPATTVTFTISEYIHTLFFSEMRITDEKTFVEAEGRADEYKLKNYYRYFLTGKIIEKDIISNVHKEQVSQKNANIAIRYLASQIIKPSTEVKSAREKLTKKFDGNIKRIDEIIKAISVAVQENKSMGISKNKLSSLLDFYSGQLAELEAVTILDDFMTGAEMKCPTCGNSIKWEATEEIEERKKQINGHINEITITANDLGKAIVNNSNKIESFQEKLCELKKENEEISIELDKIEKQLQDYITYQKCKSLITIKGRSSIDRSSIEKLNKEENEIANEFKIQMDLLCAEIKARLIAWGLETKASVGFDYEKFDFTFNGTIRPLLPKGYRGFCTVATIIELMLHMKNIGVPCFDFILVDTVWKMASFETEDLDSVIGKFLSNIATCGIQIIVFENEEPKETLDDVKFIRV